MNDKSKLSFQIEVRRILEILSNDIYDSPYALLRENIQNGYDAILMKLQLDKSGSYLPQIDVKLDSDFITIMDNGIGMNEDVVTNNFWKAGSSGKNNELAQKAGVVGTFGIGAMANFGVCKSLKVITHFLGENVTIETRAQREMLSVTEECIDFERRTEVRESGTTVIAELDEGIRLNENEAIGYLEPYVKYLKIPVTINGKNISQNSYQEFSNVKAENLLSTESYSISENGLRFDLKVHFSKQNPVKVLCQNIHQGELPVDGEIALTQGVGSIYGLRNYFGLAPVPVSGYFNLGGVVNLSSLHPTAGREALSRESIETVSQIVRLVENKIGESISGLELADNNPAFLSFVAATGRYDLANNVKIEVRPGNDRWNLNDIAPVVNDRKVYYYSGRDPQTILAFGNENSYLLLLSQDNPRRQIQGFHVSQKGIEEVPDRATILKTYDRMELSIAEASLTLRITHVLNEDYLISDTRVLFAEISHQVPSIVEFKEDVVWIYLSRDSGAVQQVLQAYDTAWEVFDGFVKDFVRNHLYQKFSSHVPSSTKQGADALHKILMRNRELFKYEYSDMGALESVMSEYVSGAIDFPEVLKRSSTIIKTHSQSVGQNQVGTVEQELPSIIQNADVSDSSVDEYGPLPPIIRTDRTDKKILKTGKAYQQLNNFSLFLGLSEKVFKTQQEFFLEPHTTKVIWSMHKLVYIFTHASKRLSFYYDIELKEKLADDTTGGKSLPTTTIVTANRIFIPIFEELVENFDIPEGTKEFYVRYDIIADFSTS